MGMRILVSVAFTTAALGMTPGTHQSARGGRGSPRAILIPDDSSWEERFAAREVKRYVYLCTGLLVPIENEGDLPAEGARGLLVVDLSQPARASLLPSTLRKEDYESLGAQDYRLETVRSGEGSVSDNPLTIVAGGGPTGMLYGAYRLAEHLGARFFLHGDVIPDRLEVAGAAVETDGQTLDRLLSCLHETRRPLFKLRGIQPFHDFPEGPDWWNLDHYQAVIAQLPKLGMNFLGLHTYPEGHPNAEPTVWIGLPEDAAPDGSVRFAYPASYQNTLRGNWGYAPKKTGDYLFGASQLFARNAYGADVMIGHCPQPETLEDCRAVFDDTAGMLREAFLLARRLGIKTCVGTETPLTVPARLTERLQARGRNPDDPDVIRELYQGIFSRAAAAYPIDYYWLWTPEGWTWSGVSREHVEKTLQDIQLAIQAARDVKAPFTLATCGWVLGPPGDRALFDRTLPGEVPLSCINRQVGMDPVEPGFAAVGDHPKWAIPWMEDDPALTSPQIWVGRMREDARDALDYGCTGLMGIHWRTRVLGPNVSALAGAGWDQSWRTREPGSATPGPEEGPVGGQIARFPQSPIAQTEDDPLYQTVRYDVTAYRLELPNGSYAVTLQFCEPHYGEPGRRVFGVKLQGKTVVDRLDMFERVGKDRALDFTYPDVAVTDGWLKIEFPKIVEFPCIAAISVTGAKATRKINCGGSSYRDYQADWPAAGRAPRGLPAPDFWQDWAGQMFGTRAAGPLAGLLTRIDGHLPRSSDWVGGPGGLRPEEGAVSQVREAGKIAQEWGAVRPLVRGAGNLDRFDYWWSQFRLLAATAQVKVTWAGLRTALESMEALTNDEPRRKGARERGIPLYRELVGEVREVFSLLLATVSTPGEMGTVANWEQHILPGVLGETRKRLETLLDAPLPEDAIPPRGYRGPDRIILPVVRSSVAAGETLRIQVILLTRKRPAQTTLYWRVLGTETWTPAPLHHLARGVWEVEIPAQPDEVDVFEYHVVMQSTTGEPLRYPVTAPDINQTVVVMPPP